MQGSAPLRMVGRVWSKFARLRHQEITAEENEAARLDWVRQHAPGHTFADIGGLWKYMGDIAFLAEDSGATEVTLFDVGDPDLGVLDHLEWEWLDKKRGDRGSKVRYVQGNLEDPVSVKEVGPHDVVFYSGVLYHTPHPVLQLIHLREITRELAFISTLTIPEIPGFEQACIFYPYLSEKARAPYAAGYHWAGDLWGIGAPFNDHPMWGYGNCWWGITPSALRAMLTIARFEVVEERPNPNGNFMTELVVRPLPLDPSLPPLFYFRERGEAHARGEPRWSFDTWYEEQRGAEAGEAAETDDTA